MPSKMSKAATKAWATRRKGKKVKRKKAKKSKRKSRKKALTQRQPSAGKPRIMPPGKWWDYMTKEPHGAAKKPLSAAATGHLWFKVYGPEKKRKIIKTCGRIKEKKLVKSMLQ